MPISQKTAFTKLTNKMFKILKWSIVMLWILMRFVHESLYMRQFLLVMLMIVDLKTDHDEPVVNKLCWSWCWFTWYVSEICPRAVEFCCDMIYIQLVWYYKLLGIKITRNLTVIRCSLLQIVSCFQILPVWCFGIHETYLNLRKHCRKIN